MKTAAAAAEAAGEFAHLKLGLEGLELTAEGIATHHDVDRAERALIAPAVEDLAREEDHPGAGSKGGHPLRQPRGDRGAQPRGVEEHRERRRLTPRQHEPCDLVELGGTSDLDDGRAELLEHGTVLTDITLQREHAHRRRSVRGGA